jgi:Zn-dependent M16 (insulinase) family peptidase
MLWLPIVLFAGLLHSFDDVFNWWSETIKVSWEGVFQSSQIKMADLECQPPDHKNPEFCISSLGVESKCTMGSMKVDSHFRVVQQFTTDYSPNRFTQYESARTGMRVVVVDQEGPKLYGFFVLATEIHDDSGAPHTLEHLCFMGSKSYKYKGFLDKLATRAYSGTNAWTATDHTAYTLETAGWAGFAQMLPIYLEHVIVPTLTDSGCVTEVHHVDGEGNDAGVVYSEMQGVQNTASELMELTAKRIIYPRETGFRYETGGMLEQLRELSADRIRDFHREMYQPKNLCLALFGEINHDHLLEILNAFESTILDDIPSPTAPFKRPWIDSEQIPPLLKSVIETVEFPEEDESFGQIEILFLGPDCADALLTGALNIALLYLAGSPAALLDNNIVEKEQLASGVYFQTDSRPRTEISFSISGVETDKLESVERRFFEVLQDAMNKDLDMGFMQDCIDRQIRTFKFTTEASSTAFSDHIIADFLYGKRDGSTLRTVATLQEYDKLSKWSQEQWRGFIKDTISHAHHVSILGKPSAALSAKLKADEETRIERQKQKLGPQGLKEMQEKLNKAKAENDKEIPTDLLARFRVPSTESIHFVNTSSARSGPALDVGRPQNRFQKIVDADNSHNPLFLDFEHIPSNFVRVYFMISTHDLPLELLPLLSIYMEAFFNLPVKRDGHTVDFEQVVVELERDTVGYDIQSAGDLGNVESLRVNLQVELEKYTVAIDWIKELLWSSIFDVERLQAITARLLADVPESKRKGSAMLGAVTSMIHLAPESIDRCRSTLVQALYLKRVKHLLKINPEAVVARFEQLRSKLCRFENFRVLVIGDLEKLPNPVASWEMFMKGLDTDKLLSPLGKRIERLSDAGKHPGKLAYIVPMATVDSSFAFCTAQGPKSFDDPNLPALMVAISYMNAVEGPLWVAVRGTGLAYGTSMSYDIESGHIHLDVYRSPEAYKAFEASKKIVEGHISGVLAFDPLMLEGAISTIVVAFATEQGTLATAAQASFIRQVMRGLPTDYMENMLKKVRDIDVDQIKNVLKSVVLNLFTSGKTNIVVTCAPGLKDVRDHTPRFIWTVTNPSKGIKSGLESIGFKPEIRDLNSFQDDYGLEPAGEEEEDSEEDEEVEEDGVEDDDVQDAST